MIEFTVPVTELARFCHRSGDIDHRFTPSPTGVQGIAGHQRLYARRSPSYESEHAVEHLHEQQDLQLTLRGRADGYDPHAGLVEEIKTCRVPASSIPEAVSRLHLAQGRLYAAMIAQRDNLPQLEVQLTWLNIDTNEEHNLNQLYSRAELDDFLHSTLERFGDWLLLLGELRRKRDASLKQLSFPYGDFREGQRDIAELTYKCIDQGGKLLLEAPTGIGKTAAVLFPALKALGTAKHEKVVFATAKTVGRKAAEDTLLHFADAGYKGTALSLTAKEKICLSPGRACHGDDCPYARNYYDKLPQAMDAAITRGALPRSTVEELAKQFEVCPYELALDLLPWVDVVIADLHYVYSLTATLGNAMENGDERWTVLLDEAHNLPGRARGMYSAHLSKASLMQSRKDSDGALLKALNRINRQFLNLQNDTWQETDFHSSQSLPEPLLLALQDMVGVTSELLGQEPAFLQRHPTLMDFYFDVLHFLRVAEQFADDYRFQLNRGAGKNAKQSLKLVLNCLDPSRLLAQRQDRAHAVTSFSATLSPMEWSRAALGLDEDTVCSRAHSPFQKEQLAVALATHIDTRYRQRTATLPQLAMLVRDWLEGRAGNCIVYFPSYKYMQDCLVQMNVAAKPIKGRTLWQQQREANDTTQQTLLDLLSARTDVAAFCILGGVFGEAIDLPGEQLASVVIVGVGMPQVNRDTRELQAWHEARRGAGFEYTFLYPGMQKVDQALGRVVRRMDDHGSALLIDTRYGDAQYRDLLPTWWQYDDWPSS